MPDTVHRDWHVPVDLTDICLQVGVDVSASNCNDCFLQWLGGVTVRASDLQSSGRGFDSRLGRYQAT